MRRAFPELAADWLLLVGFCTVGVDDVVPGSCSFPCSREVDGKSTHAMRGDLQHDRCDEKEESGAQLSGERTSDQTTNDSAKRSADSNKSEKPFGLLGRENVSHERPKHCSGEKIEDADPDEKYGRKDLQFLSRLASSAMRRKNTKRFATAKRYAIGINRRRDMRVTMAA